MKNYKIYTLYTLHAMHANEKASSSRGYLPVDDNVTILTVTTAIFVESMVLRASYFTCVTLIPSLTVTEGPGAMEGSRDISNFFFNSSEFESFGSTAWDFGLNAAIIYNIYN